MICPRCKKDRTRIKGPTGLCDYCHNMQEYLNGNPRYFLCPICGKADTPDDWMDMDWETMKYCHSCHFWDEKAKLYNQGRLIVVDGRAYYLGNENAGRFFRGFGGARFKIHKLSTGETFISTNLWFNGEIPDKFRPSMPDNAEFLY